MRAAVEQLEQTKAALSPVAAMVDWRMRAARTYMRRGSSSRPAALPAK